MKNLSRFSLFTLLILVTLSSYAKTHKRVKADSGPQSGDLIGLTVDLGQLSPAFSYDVTSYTLDVGQTPYNLIIKPTLYDPATSTYSAPEPYRPDLKAYEITLAYGYNDIKITTTSTVTHKTKVYNIIAVREFAIAWLLTGLDFSAGKVTPGVLRKFRCDFIDSVLYTTTSVTITPRGAYSGSYVLINELYVPPGSSSTPIQLPVGTTNVSFYIQGPIPYGNPFGYNIKIVRAAAPTADLASLVPSLVGGTITPAFSPNITNYTIRLPQPRTPVKIAANAVDTTASVVVNGTKLSYGQSTPPINFSSDTGQVNVVVQSKDNSVKKTYVINVIYVASADARLKSMQPSVGGFSPVFNEADSIYTSKVPNTVSSITLQPVVNNSYATVTVNGTAVTSGATSPLIPLAVGDNVIHTVVTAQDGKTTKTYTLTVSRQSATSSTIATLSSMHPSSGGLSPGFMATKNNYTSTVNNSLTSITITPVVTDPGATVQVNGIMVASGATSPVIPLAIGANTINTVVTAQDGVTQNTYTLVVTRPNISADLTGLHPSSYVILSPAFTAANTSYTSTVNRRYNTVNFTPATLDPNATVAINGTAVPHATTSPDFPLVLGNNTFSFVVTSADGSFTKTYTLVINLPGYAELSGLDPNLGVLSSPFTADNHGYTLTVPDAVKYLNFTPRAIDPNATVTVNGVVVPRGTQAGIVLYYLMNTPVTIQVTEPGGFMGQPYKISIISVPSVGVVSANDRFSLINVRIGATVYPVTFQGNYTINTSNADSATITTTASDTTANVITAGYLLASGEASPSLALKPNTNQFTVTVVAPDGTTGNYVITVNNTISNDMVNQHNIIVPEEDRPGVPFTSVSSVQSGNIFVHEGLSPNGDGINDVLLIDNIASCPDNRLQIMDGNGVLIFDASGYNNVSKTFDGHSGKTGKMQPPGTYFYSLDYKVKGATKHQTGYIMLKY